MPPQFGDRVGGLPIREPFDNEHVNGLLRHVSVCVNGVLGGVGRWLELLYLMLEEPLRFFFEHFLDFENELTVQRELFLTILFGVPFEIERRPFRLRHSLESVKRKLVRTKVPPIVPWLQQSVERRKQSDSQRNKWSRLSATFSEQSR
jgi:hypothetical protein